MSQINPGVGAGGSGGGGAVTIADGSDVAEGATTDAAVVAGSTGTVSGKLRQISADVSSVKTNQIDASQKTQVVDGSGNVIGSTSNALDVNIKSGGGSGFSVTDETAWTAGSSAMVPSGAVFNDSATALTSGQQGTVRSTANRAIHSNIRNSSGTELATASNPIRVDPTGGTTQPVSGTVTSNIGTTNGLALDASVTGLQVSQGSTTSGQKGDLIQAAVTTSAPSYTTAQTSPLSLTTSGALRTDSSATTQPVSAASLPLPTGASTSANQTNGSQKTQVVDGSGNIIGSSSNRLYTTSPDTTATGNITSNQSVTIATNGQSTVGIQVTGSFSGTLNIQGSTDGSTYSPTTAVQISNGTIVSSVSGPFNGQANVAGLQSFRILGNTVATGTAVVTLVASVSVSTIMLDNPLPSGTNTIGAVTGTGTFATQAAQSGTWNINNVSGTVSLPTGAATSAKQPALGTAGTASSDVITVQGIASMTALKVDGSAVTQPVSGTVTSNIGTTNGLALDASVTGLQVAQGSTTSGQKGNLIQGAVTTSAPTYTTAQTSPLSLTTTGALRIDGSATTQPVSGTITANAGTGTFNIQSNASVNIAQLAGNTISSGVGTSGTGTLRTVTANDTGRSLQSAGGSASSSGNNTLVAAGTNRLKVYAFTLSTTSSTSVTCIFQSGASGTELWRVVLQAPTSVSTGANLVVQPPAWLFATATATLLNLNLSAAQTVHWSVSYWDEA